MKPITILTAGLVSVALLISSACTPVQTLTTTLTTVLAAVDIAAPIVTASGLVPPAEMAVVGKYLTETSTFVSQAVTELDSSDPNTTKGFVILQEASIIVLPDLTGLTPQQRSEILAVEGAVHQVTVLVQNTLNKGGVSAHNVLRPSKADESELQQVQQRANLLKAELSAATAHVMSAK